MRKSQTAVINIFFLLLLLYLKKFMFCQKTYLEKLSLYYYICIKVFLCGRLLKKKKKTPTTIGFVDAVLRSKMLGNRLGVLTQILIAMDYFFFLYFREALSVQEKTKAIVRESFGSLHTRNRSCFLNYVYYQDMYIMTLKEIGKILIVSVLRILLICKFLNLTTVFTNKLNFPKVAYNIP